MNSEGGCKFHHEVVVSKQRPINQACTVSEKQGKANAEIEHGKKCRTADSTEIGQTCILFDGV
jgi:hypothetical protein